MILPNTFNIALYSYFVYIYIENAQDQWKTLTNTKSEPKNERRDIE